jgi:hypothetical protein
MRFSSLAEVADRLTVIAKDKRPIRLPIFASSVEHFEKLATSRQHAAILVLALLRAESHFMPREINVAPFQRAHLADAPTREIEERYWIFQMACVGLCPGHKHSGKHQPKSSSLTPISNRRIRQALWMPTPERGYLQQSLADDILLPTDRTR